MGPGTARQEEDRSDAARYEDSVSSLYGGEEERREEDENQNDGDEE